MKGSRKDGARQETPPADEASADFRRHLRFGWWSLLVYLGLGLVLEGLHGFKAGWYLDAPQQTRRLMWTLAHAHGTLLAMVNLAFAMTVKLVPGWGAASRRQAGWWLLGASVLLPLGFLVGGVRFHAGDPGVGIFLVAAGGLMLLVAVLLIAAGTAAALRSDARRTP
jgi:hypothetical protein